MSSAELERQGRFLLFKLRTLHVLRTKEPFCSLPVYFAETQG
jgi:hypothetical protein